MIQNEGTFRGARGVELHYRTWAPEEEARAVVAIVHGLGEHGGRYGGVANYLVPAGYKLYAFDHRGHGRSPGPRGHADRWADFREDVRAFLTLIRKQAPGKPIFLYGHSLGGLITLNYALHEPAGIDGLIVSAPGLDASGLSPTMLRIARLLSRVAPKLGLGTGLEAAAISRDPAEVKAYKLDPLVHGKGSPRLAVEAGEAIEWTMAHAKELRLPLLLFYGSADRLVPPANARRFFDAASSKDKTLHEYEGGYHEPHNDLDRERVLADVREWLDERSPQGL